MKSSIKNQFYLLNLLIGSIFIFTPFGSIGAQTIDLNVVNSNCVDNLDGTFTANYDAIVSWDCATGCAAGEMIQLTVNGVVVSTIDPATATSPITISFNIDANGTGTNNVLAELLTAGTSENYNFKTPVPCSTNAAMCTGMSQCIGGFSYQDVDCNGINDSCDAGVEGIEVTVYDCDNVLMGTTYTDADGDWQLCGLANGSKYRVEFNLPESIACWANPSHFGTGNGTDVQFVTAPACADFSITDPQDYCQDNPYLVVPCYIEGGNGGNDEVLVRWSYNNQGLLPGDMTPISVENQIATTWGTAYDRVNETIYASAVLKRHAKLHEGPTGGGLDAIFAVDPFSPANGTVWLELTDDLGIDVGQALVPNNTTRELNLTDQHDTAVYDDVGKVGIGDIDISADNKTLYVMNLFDKTLYAIDIASKMVVGTYPVPDPGCVNGEHRPWAVEYHEGAVYVGAICDASTAGKDATAPDALTNTTGRSDLHAYIFRLDAAGTYSEVLDFPLDYTKQSPHGTWGNHTLVDGWFPWTDDVPLDATTFPSVNVYWIY